MNSVMDYYDIYVCIIMRSQMDYYEIPNGLLWNSKWIIMKFVLRYYEQFVELLWRVIMKFVYNFHSIHRVIMKSESRYYENMFALLWSVHNNLCVIMTFHNNSHIIANSKLTVGNLVVNFFLGVRNDVYLDILKSDRKEI